MLHLLSTVFALLSVAPLLVTAAPDPTCATGILDANGQNCCAAACGRCGGTGCQARPGGSRACCSGSIAGAGKSCAEDAPPCAMPPSPAPPPGLNRTALACAVRRLALRAAAQRLGAAGGASALADVSDALRLHECGGAGAAAAAVAAAAAAHAAAHAHAAPAGPPPADAIWVATDGDDAAGDGSAARPFASPLRARDAARKRPAGTAVVVLRGGTYHLGSLQRGAPLLLDDAARDSHTTWMADPVAAPGRPPVLSGSVALGSLRWSPAPSASRAPAGALVANVSALLPPGFAVLLRAGAGAGGTAGRLVRARVPNGSPVEISGLCFMGGALPNEGCAAYFKAAGGAGAFNASVLSKTNFAVPKGGLVAGDALYSNYSVEVQAPPRFAAGVLPPSLAGALRNATCPTSHGSGDSYGLYGRTAGIKVGRDFFGGNETHDPASWARPREAVVHMMHNNWGNVQFALDSVDAAGSALRFAYGGWQHGRSGGSGNFYVENVLEELDAPDEWYYDADAQLLYVRPNGTDAGAIGSLLAPTMETVLLVSGSAARPVTGVAFRGLSFANTAPTFLRPYERPPSGDWAIHRGGAVLVTGAVNVSFVGGAFADAGGNALTFSRHAKNCSVTDAEFVRPGDSAVVAYGEVDGATGDSIVGSAAVLPDSYPSGLLVARNHMHEIGVWGKQTSCFFQGVSGRNTFEANVCYNGPRALVNLNDGFLGLSIVRDNVLFNPCRESHDHGAFNSWDRTPMRFRSADSHGDPSWTPGETAISRNLVLNSYGGSHNIDHDDGSEYFDASDNVAAFAQVCKGNYGSHRKCNRNLVIAPGMSMYAPEAGAGGGNCASESDNGAFSTYADKHFDNNTCIQDGKPGGTVTAYAWKACSVATRNFNASCWGSRGNTFLVPEGVGVVVGCGSTSVPLATWQRAYGREVGGRVQPMPELAQIVAMAEDKLGIDGALW